MTDKAELVRRAKYRVGNPSAWESFDEGASELIRELANALESAGPEDQPVQPDDTHAFKNFHRLLCDRFGYSHDEVDWRRDQVSLIEWIAQRITPQPASAGPAAICDVLTMGHSSGFPDYFSRVKVGDRSLTFFMSKIKGRCEYHAAEFNWLLNGGEKPHILAFDDTEPEGLADYLKSIAPPVAGTGEAKPLRYCDYCKTWNSKPCGEQCVWTPSMPTSLATPKAPSAVTEAMVERYRTHDIALGCQNNRTPDPHPDGSYVKLEAYTSLAAEVEALKRERDRCHARLEIDHHFIMPPNAETADDLVRVETPMSERGREIDGIEARDATISLLEQDNERLASDLAQCREALEPFAKAVEKADKNARLGGFALSFDEYKTEWSFTFGQLRRARAALPPPPVTKETQE